MYVSISIAFCCCCCNNNTKKSKLNRTEADEIGFFLFSLFYDGNMQLMWMLFFRDLFFQWYCLIAFSVASVAAATHWKIIRNPSTQITNELSCNLITVSVQFIYCTYKRKKWIIAGTASAAAAAAICHNHESNIIWVH